MRRQVLALSLIGEAVAIAIWWLVLVLVPGARAAFHPQALPEAALLQFWLADVALVGVLVVAAIAVWRARAWAPQALWAAAGAISYGALYCVAQWVATRGAPLAALSMVAASLLTIVVARAHAGGR